MVHPVRRQRGLLRALPCGGHGDDRGPVTVANLVDVRASPTGGGSDVSRKPVAGSRRDRVRQQPQPLPLVGRDVEPREQPGPDPVMQVGVSAGVTPAQIRQQTVAGHVVREQPVRSLVDERQRAQPGEQLAGVVAEHRSQQVLGGDVGVRADLQCRAVPWSRRRLDRLREQRPHDVGQVAERARLSAPTYRIDQHGQRERMAVAHGEQSIVQLRSDALLGQVGPHVPGPQVAQGDHLH